MMKISTNFNLRDIAQGGRSTIDDVLVISIEAISAHILNAKNSMDRKAVSTSISKLNTMEEIRLIEKR